MRIIVFGSRTWRDRETVFGALDEAAVEHAALTVVHGACPTGADALADEWARAQFRPVRIESFPADWAKHGKPAGMIRNREMAKAGADLALGFFNGWTPGSANMVRCCVEAGIPVRIVARKLEAVRKGAVA